MSLSSEHNSLDEIADFLRRFSALQIRYLNYGAFASILRLQIIDPDGDDWIVVLDQCTYIRGAVWWRLGSLDLARDSNGKLVITDPTNDFRVNCKTCVVLHEDEYGDAED